jgi:hypothetical protein
MPTRRPARAAFLIAVAFVVIVAARGAYRIYDEGWYRGRELQPAEAHGAMNSHLDKDFSIGLPAGATVPKWTRFPSDKGDTFALIQLGPGQADAFAKSVIEGAPRVPDDRDLKVYRVKPHFDVDVYPGVRIPRWWTSSGPGAAQAVTAVIRTRGGSTTEYYFIFERESDRVYVYMWSV